MRPTCIILFLFGLSALVFVCATAAKPKTVIPTPTNWELRISILEKEVKGLKKVVGLEGHEARPEGMQHKLYKEGKK